MINKLVERTAGFLTKSTGKTNPDTYARMKYGVELLYMNVYKTVLLIIAILVLGIWKEVLIFAFSYCLMRTFAHGIHLDSGLGCTVWGFINYIGCAYLVRLFTFDTFWTWTVFAVLLTLYAIYAPAATRKRPIGKKERVRLKAGALISLIGLLIMTVFFRTGDISDLLLLGIIAESINILPVTYRIFRQNGGEYK